MTPGRFGFLAALAGVLLLGSSPPRPAFAQAEGVKGQDVMQPRAGPDGWAQAPIPRDQSPSGSSPGEDKPNKSAESGRGNVPDTGKRLSPGQDPGTPMPRPATDPMNSPPNGPSRAP